MLLDEVLADPARRARFVHDGAAVVEAEVARKGGLGGMALRGGLKAVQAVRPDVVQVALDALLPAFSRAMASHVAEAQRQGDIAAYFASRGGPVADALLAVTDARAQSAENPIIRKTYAALRSSARAHTVEAAPALGRLLAQHLPAGA